MELPRTGRWEEEGGLYPADKSKGLGVVTLEGVREHRSRSYAKRRERDTTEDWRNRRESDKFPY